jgi:hypothetical protein
VSSEYVNFWDYDRDAVVSCPSCGWTGRPGDNEGIHRDLLDVCCPECKRMLLIVPFPTGAETRAAAAAGNQLAQAELPHLDAIESRMRRAHRLELRPSFLTSTAAGSSSIGISKSATTRSGRFCVTATGRSGANWPTTRAIGASLRSSESCASATGRDWPKFVRRRRVESICTATSSLHEPQSTHSMHP